MSANTDLPFEEGGIEQTEPPCDKCRIDIKHENVPVMDVFVRCNDDWIMAGPDRVRSTISGPAIKTAMNIVGITSKRERMIVFDKIKMVGRVLARELLQEQIKLRRNSR